MPILEDDVPEIPVGDGGVPPTVSDGDGAVASPVFAPGESNGVAAKLSQLSARADVALLYSGPPRIASGLEISTVGLVASVSAGVAISQGLVVVEEDIEAIALTNNTTKYVWLLPTNASVVLSEAPPAPGAIYLGSITTSAGASTHHTWGVLYCRGGIPWRELDQAGAPLDEPGGYCLLTRCDTSTYFWDGDTHHLLTTGGATGIVSLAPVTPGGTAGALTVVAGLITNITAPT